MIRHCNGVCIYGDKNLFLVKQRGLGSNVFSLIHLNDLTVQRNGYLYATVIRQNARLQPLLRLHINVL